MQQEYTPKQLAWMFGVNCRQLRNFEQQFGALPGKRKTGTAGARADVWYTVESVAYLEQQLQRTPLPLDLPHPQPVAVSKVERSLFFNDAHIPSHDQRLFEETFYPFLEWLKPEKIYILGDLIDCKPLGKYRKEPSETYGQQYEYDKAEEVLRTIRGIVGQSTTIDYLLGNHEHRLHNYLCDHPELFGLRTLTFTELLHTNDYGVTVHPYYQDPIFYAGVALEHRDTVRCNSVYTAKSMYEKRGVSGISGHTHRVGIYTKTTLRGEEFWIENGHMSDVKKATYTYHPDWAHGWSVGHLYPDDSRVVVSQVIVRNYRAYFGGHEFAKGKVA